MRLFFLGSGAQVPSCRYRVLQWLPHLRAAGHPCQAALSVPEKYEYYRWLGFRPSQWLKRGKRSLDLARARLTRPDAIILEREIFDNPSIDFEQAFRRLNTTMVLDIDDAVFVRHPGKMEALMPQMDLIVAGNDELADWSRKLNPHVVTVPTCLDLQQYKPDIRTQIRPPESPKGRWVIGWMGTQGNLPCLELALEGIRQISKEHPVLLRIVTNRSAITGSPRSSLNLAGLEHEWMAWSPELEMEQLSGMDVGIMPLVNDEWSRFKCGLKLLLYMSLGIPAIASPVGVNTAILHHGVNGYLAETPAEWAYGLSRLLSDAGHREDVGRAAARRVAADFSIQSQIDRWTAAVQAAIGRRSKDRRGH
jgi:glycosyltransferase involved in cell wall biosynthesis